jgi:hypothetical protein
MRRAVFLVPPHRNDPPGLDVDLAPGSPPHRPISREHQPLRVIGGARLERELQLPRTVSDRDLTGGTVLIPFCV